MDIALLIEWIIKAVVILAVMTAGFAYVTWLERKELARIQARIGPNRAGFAGLLLPVADGIKLIFKEELIPVNADKLMFVLAPVITVIPSLIVTAVIPWGRTVELFGRSVHLVLADINVAILYILSVTSISVYGITLAGWSSNNKYATLGGLRATAQMISYEIALGFAMLGPVMMAGSMSMVGIVEAQKNLWFAIPQFIAFIIYIIASLAEVNRSPFDMPEAEQELTAGYITEYSGMKFALFFMAEYIKVIAISMIGASLFLGGYLGPFVDQFPGLGVLYFWAKTVLWIMFIIWVRATLPRVRYDRLMAMGWKVLFPLALLNVLVTAVISLLK
ncbi:MAG: NADH-quinone oxidoreductase subunit NuoH [Anaerolineae bacterium]|nr:NADH-quinone oxidoreductase subunit NuoH [Anaerolineae bacterium]